jgi:transcriptional regulator with XRE-family HTH domain
MANQTVKSIGDYIREQREQARISMRQLAQSAGVSNPYLSQIERGLRKPSADILQQLAKGLRISAEALYVQAGILEDRPADSGVRSALLTDPDLSERQKQVLIEIYESFRKENTAAAEAQAAQAEAQTAQAAAEVEAAQGATEAAQAVTEAAASEAAQAAAEAAAMAQASNTKARATKVSAMKASVTKASAAKASATKSSVTKSSVTKSSVTKPSVTKASATKASATKASAEAADDRPSRSSWSAATAEAERDESSGSADGVPGANGPSD